MKRPISCWGGCFGAFFGIVGLIMLVIGVLWGVSTWQRTQTSVETRGKIVGIEVERRLDGVMEIYPIVEFETPDGTRHRFQSNEKLGTVGRIDATAVIRGVDVLYDPNNPSDAIHATRTSLWVPPVVFVAMGLLFVGLGVATMSRIGSAVIEAAARRRRQAITMEDIEASWLDDTDPAEDPGDDRGSSAARGPSFRAEYRGVEPSQPDAEGKFMYRIVARSDDGETFYGDWLDADPSIRLMTSGIKEVDVVWRDGRYVIATPGKG